MKKSYYVLLVAALACLQPSCKKEIDGLGISTGEVESVTMQAKDLLYSDLNQPSKTSLSFKNNAAEFSWKSTDVVGVFPDEGTQVRFPIADGHVEEGTATSEAHFTGCGWAVKKQHSYMAYYPFVPDMNMDKTAIPVTFANQIQKGNANSDHIEVFDYMAAALQEPTKTGEIAFHFEHLGCLFEFVVRAPKAAEYTSLSLSSNGQFIIDGQYDLTAGVPAIEAVSTSNELVLSLEDIQTTEPDEELRLYMMMAPVDLTGQDIIVKLKGPHAEFEVNLGPGTNFRAGRFYRPSLSGIQGGDIIMLEDGTAFCHDVKTLANGEDFPSGKTDYMIRHIKFETSNSEVPEGIAGKDYCDVSNFDSPAPIYAIWDVNTRTITVRSGGLYIYANPFIPGMFSNFNKLEDIDFTGLNTSQVVDMQSCFPFCPSLKELDFTGLEFPNLYNMNQAFEECTSLETIKGLRPDGNVILSFAFMNCNKLKSIDLSGWKISDFTYTFRSCSSLTDINFDGIDTRNCESLYGMFLFCSSLKSIDISMFSCDNMEHVAGMFSECYELEHVELCNNFGGRKVRAYGGMFQSCRKLKSIDMTKFAFFEVEDFTGMFNGCESLESIDVAGLVTTNVYNIDSMFRGCKSLISIDLSSWNTSAVTRMSSLFEGCSSLSSIDLSSLNTSNVEYMNNMFGGCTSLSSIDLSNFDTSRLKEMGGMFYDCSALETLDLSMFDTSNLSGSLGDVFRGCANLTTIDLSHFDTSNVTHMGGMFSGCTNLESVNITGFKTGKVGGFDRMFYDCENLQEIKGIEDLDTHFADSFEDMFRNCKSLERLDLSKWQTPQASNFGTMFAFCTNLKYIDVSSFNTEHMSVGQLMFIATDALKTLKLGDKFIYDSSNFWMTVFNGNQNMDIYCSRAVMDNIRDSNEADHGFWVANNFYDFHTNVLMKAAGSETEL